MISASRRDKASLLHDALPRLQRHVAPMMNYARRPMAIKIDAGADAAARVIPALYG